MGMGVDRGKGVSCNYSDGLPISCSAHRLN